MGPCGGDIVVSAALRFPRATVGLALVGLAGGFLAVTVGLAVVGHAIELPGLTVDPAEVGLALGFPGVTVGESIVTSASALPMENVGVAVSGTAGGPDGVVSALCRVNSALISALAASDSPANPVPSSFASSVPLNSCSRSAGKIAWHSTDVTSPKHCKIALMSTSTLDNTSSQNALPGEFAPRQLSRFANSESTKGATIVPLFSTTRSKYSFMISTPNVLTASFSAGLPSGSIRLVKARAMVTFWLPFFCN